MERKGISLVALVITIIVLIILTAGVIMLAGGENGIIARAQRAAEENNRAAAVEKVLLEVSNIKIDAAVNGETVAQYLYDEINGEDARMSLEEKGIVISEIPPSGQEMVFRVGRYSVITDLNGNIELTNNYYYLGEAVNSGRYGDVINYGVDVDSTAGNTATETHIDGWKIFYEDSDYLYIITADYLDNTKLPTALNMSTSSGSPYSAYWSSASNFTYEGSEINPGKATKFGLAMVVNNMDPLANSTKAVADLLADCWTDEFGGGIEGITCEAIGTPTLEMLIKSWNTKGYRNFYCASSEEEGYYIDTTIEVHSYYIFISGDSDEYSDKLYYPHQYFLGGSEGYWLAAPSAYAYKELINMRCDESAGGSMGSNSHSNERRAIRPVVAIPKADVILTETASGVWDVCAREL